MNYPNALSFMSQKTSPHFRRLALSLAAGAMIVGPTSLQAQATPGEDPGLVDRVVAVVGDSAIFLSQVEEELMLRFAGGGLAAEPDSLRAQMRAVLEELVNMQLILQEAALDSTLAPQEEAIEAQVTQTVAQVQARFPNVQAFNEQLANDGLTMTTYRETLRRRIREQQIQQLFLQRRLAGGTTVAVTEAEMRSYFAANEARLEQRPELLSLEQIVFRPGASDAAWAAKKDLADSLIAELRGGADFAAMAIAMSEDPGSGAQGGELPWFRRGQMLTSFEEGAFALADMQISEPVRSPVGWHIIRVDRRRPGELKARHILLIPETNAADVVRITQQADSVAQMIRAGEPVANLRLRYGDQEQSGAFTVSRQQINEELPPGYANALAGAASGQVVGPFQTTLEQGRPVTVVLRVAEVRAAGRLTFEDVEDQIREQLQSQKRLERLWQSLRSDTYVDIRF